MERMSRGQKNENEPSNYLGWLGDGGDLESDQCCFATRGHRPTRKVRICCFGENTGPRSIRPCMIAVFLLSDHAS